MGLQVQQKRQEAGLEGSAKGESERLPNHVLPRQPVRRSGTLALVKTVAPLVELPGSPVGFPEVVAVVVAAKNTVLWGKVVIGGEGLGIAGEEGNRIAVGMSAAEVQE